MNIKENRMKMTSMLKMLLALCMGIVLITAGCGKDHHADEDEHDESHGHEEGEEADPLSMSKDELMIARCEHDVPTHQCDECRYEIGVVKVDAELFKGKDSQSSGLVALSEVTKRMMASTIDVTGEISLNENTTTHVNPRIEGIVHSVNVDLGSQVKKDDVLFSIDSIELGATLTEYVKHRSLASLTGKNFEGEKSLHEREISSERELIEMQMIFEEHQTNLKAAEHKLNVLGLNEEQIAAMADVGHDEKQLALLPVRTHIDGTIIEKHVVAGELIEPGDDVMIVANLDTVWVWADIYEDNLAGLLARKTEKGSIPVRVIVDAFPERTFAGFIDYIGATMDEGTRTVKVRATLDNSDGLLRPGMFCKVNIAMGEDKEVLAIPASALLSDEGVEFVFTQLTDELYVRRLVTKGRSANGFVELVSGLSEGEPIVTEGCFLLKSDVLREKMGAGCAD